MAHKSESVVPIKLEYSENVVRHHPNQLDQVRVVENPTMPSSTGFNRSNAGQIGAAEIMNAAVTDKQELTDAEKHQLKIALGKLCKPNILVRPWYFLCGKCAHLVNSYEIKLKRLDKKSLEKDEEKQAEQQYESQSTKRSLYGLFAGILVGYFSFFLFLFTFSHSPYLSTLVSCYLMMICIFGFAFSADFRCTALLVVPYVAASRIRWLLLLLATTLVITGPGLNFLHNSGNFRNSIACVLAQVDTNVQLIKKLTAAPFSLMGGRIKNLIQNVNQALSKIRDTMKSINFALLKITNVMERQSSWLRSIAMACGDAVALRNQCLAFFNNIYFNCKASLKYISGLCGLVRHYADEACSKNLNNLVQQCKSKSDALQDEFDMPLSANMTAQMETILDTLGRDDLQTGGDMDKSEKVNVGADSSIPKLLESRVVGLATRIQGVKNVISWIILIWTLITMLMLVIQAIHFKRSWLKSDMFDNFYITEDFIKQERRAVLLGLVPTVPLLRKERKVYKRLDSLGWTVQEKRKAFQSALVIFLWMLSIAMVIVTDYAMYFLVVTVMPLYAVDLSRMGSEGRAGQDFEQSATQEMETESITSESSFSNIVKSMMSMINPLKDIAMNLDITACKPTASEPNGNTNIWIGVLLCSIAFSLLIQIYVMRVRHVIMIWYFPERSAERAAWLRTHIRNNRGLFHRLIHKFKTSDLDTKRKAAKVSMLGRFLGRNPKIRRLLAKLGIKRVTCEFCGEEGNPGKKAKFKVNFIQCPECGKYYCKACQVDLEHICMVCRTPLQAMEMEIDFEQYSSDEQYETMCNRYLRRAEQATNVINRIVANPEKVEMDRPKI